LNLPPWYTQGLVSYISEDWNATIDNHVKDGVLRGNYKKYGNLSGDEAVYAGHSIWRFIADKYGPAAISNIVYLTKISRSVESGFLYVLGVKFKTLAIDWLAYYEQKYTEDESGRQTIDAKPLQKKVKKNAVYSQLKISSDGKFAAYTSNIMGQYRVYLRDLETGKTKLLMKREHKLDEKTDYSFPLLTWHPSGKLLAIIIETKGKNMMYSYMIDEKRFEKEQLFTLEKILDFSFSQNGKMIVFSGVVQGQTDIYVFNIAAHTYEPITKDIYDDLNPHFINNSKEIIFSSNRPDDTIRFDVLTYLESAKDSIVQLSPQTDIFLYNYATKNPVLRRITNTPYATESQPMQYDSKFFTYLSDENGIINRYIARVDSTISFVDTTTHYRYYTTSYPVTDYSRNILEQDFSPKSGKYGEVIFNKGLYNLFLNDLIPAKQIPKTHPANTYYREQYLKTLDTSTVQKTTPINTEEVDMIKSRKTKPKKINNVMINEIEVLNDTSVVDIYHYNIGGSKKDSTKRADSLLKKKYTFQIPRQGNYDVEYSINQLVGQVDFNFLNASYQQFTGGGSPIYMNPGLNLNFQLGVIDLLEDYRISGGARISLSFDDYEFFIGYENLKKRLDRGIFFYRQSNINANSASILKLRSNSLFYTLKWPFSKVLALKGTASVRYDKKVFAATDINNLQQANINEYWAGIKGELTFDNTQAKALNINYGWRWKLFGEYYQKIADQFNNLIVLGLDFRHYQKIHRTFIWANRLAASTSFGNSKLVYYLGGVDNWIIPTFNTQNVVAQDQNYNYQTLATNMRGFSQNVRNGPSFFVLNSELRFPIIQYFAKRPLKNNFINNMQIVGFGDIGTAWLGWNPYSEENTLTKTFIQRGPMFITVIKKRDPLVGGFGVGLRTKLLGYFIRADYAWGVENAVIQKAVFYISLGLDF
jgi:Tol biopolymer transport system component